MMSNDHLSAFRPSGRVRQTGWLLVLCAVFLPFGIDPVLAQDLGEPVGPSAARACEPADWTVSAAREGLNRSSRTENCLSGKVRTGAADRKPQCQAHGAGAERPEIQDLAASTNPQVRPGGIASDSRAGPGRGKAARVSGHVVHLNPRRAVREPKAPAAGLGAIGNTGVGSTVGSLACGRCVQRWVNPNGTADPTASACARIEGPSLRAAPASRTATEEDRYGAATMQVPERVVTTVASAITDPRDALNALVDGESDWCRWFDAQVPVAITTATATVAADLTNPAPVPEPPGDGRHVVTRFPAASDSLGRQGVLRLVNRSDATGQVRIESRDDRGGEHKALTLAMGARESKRVTSEDLQFGNGVAATCGGPGAEPGDWRLTLTSEVDIEVLAYVRIADGTLTLITETEPPSGDTHRVVTWSSGGDSDRANDLRLVNPGLRDASVTLYGTDDDGAAGGPVRLRLPAGRSRMLTAVELENGAEGLTGSLGEGVGRWLLDVTSSEAIAVISQASSPDGRLTHVPARSSHGDTQGGVLPRSGPCAAG